MTDRPTTATAARRSRTAARGARDDVGDDYVCELTDAARRRARRRPRARRGPAPSDSSTSPLDDFPLPDARAPSSPRLTDELIDGRGVVLIRGVPVDRYGQGPGRRPSTGASGTHLGRPVAAEPQGPPARRRHRPGQGRSTTPPAAATRSAASPFPFHSDGSDLVGLFCLDAGASGGASLVANAVSIHNELVRTAPELAAALYEPFAYDMRGEETPGSRPWYLMPVFTQQARPAVRALHPALHPRRPAATPTRPRRRRPPREAMDRVDAMCADPDVPPVDAAAARATCSS